jgi:hypothetical protein
MQPQAAPGMHERARHPARLETKDAAATVDEVLDL